MEGTWEDSFQLLGFGVITEGVPGLPVHSCVNVWRESEAINPVKEPPAKKFLGVIVRGGGGGVDNQVRVETL